MLYINILLGNILIRMNKDPSSLETCSQALIPWKNILGGFPSDLYLKPLVAAGTLSPPLHAVLRLRACFPQPGSPPLGRFVFIYSPQDEVTLSALVCSLRPQILVCPSLAAPAPHPRAQTEKEDVLHHPPCHLCPSLWGVYGWF